jgi:hypothetical protein
LGKLLLAGGFFILAATGLGQIISPEIYQTEEDLLEGLQNGELTFDQYLELLDLMRQKEMLGEVDTQLVLEVPDLDYSGLDTSDYETKQKLAGYTQTVPVKKKETRGVIVLQHRQRISEESQPESYFRMRAGNGGSWNFFLESENEENENRIKRRAVEFNRTNNWNIVLGNFNPHYGLGVNVGNRTYLNFSSDNSLESENTILFPFWTRYNGIFASYQRRNHSASGFYSQSRFGDYKDQVWAGEINLRWRHFLISPILSYQEISRGGSKFISKAGSIFAKINGEKGEIGGELAVTDQKEKGGVVEALWQPGKKITTQVLFWSYSRDFLHPVSGGKALPDYRRMELENLDLEQRSRQAGETGFYFSNLVRFNPRTRLDIAYQQWKDGNSYLNKNKARIGIGHWFKKNLEVRLKQYWEDDNLAASFPERNTTTLVGTHLFTENTKLQVRLNYRSSAIEGQNVNSTWEEILLYFPVKTNLTSRLRVRYRDDDISSGEHSSWSFYIDESFWLADNLKLMAEFVSKEYEDLEREDLQVVRVRMEWSL